MADKCPVCGQKRLGMLCSACGVRQPDCELHDTRIAELEQEAAKRPEWLKALALSRRKLRIALSAALARLDAYEERDQNADLRKVLADDRQQEGGA